jgi:tetratricopeptide (TPR) repeat protein
MKRNIDMSPVKVFFRVFTLNTKKAVDWLINRYNGLFQITPKDAEDIYTDIGDDLEIKGDYDGAVKAYNKVLSSSPDNVDVLFKLGKAHLGRRAPKDAYEAFKKVTAMKAHGKAYYYLGACSFMMDDNNEALEAFRTSIEMDPGNSEAHYKLGLVYDNMSDYDNAIGAYDKALSINPNLIKAYHSIGLSYEAKGMREEAVKFFKKSIKMEERVI